MPSTSFTILLILNLALPVFGISCYSYSAYQNTQTVHHNKSYCLAIYEVANGHGSFSGVSRDPIKTEKLKWDYNMGKDCKMEKTRLEEDKDFQVVYKCVCFSSMCNFPFSFEEFKARNFTLAPKPSNSIW